MFGPGYLSELAYTLMGVNAVITWAKLFKYLNSFPHLAMLSKTLANAIHPVRNFSIMFFIVFLSTGQAFNMAFGAHIDGYSTASGAIGGGGVSGGAGKGLASASARPPPASS